MSLQSTGLNGLAREFEQASRILTSIGWLPTVAPDFADALLGRIRWLNRPAGSALFDYLSEDGVTYGIAGGQVEFSTLTSDGLPTPIHYLNRGEWFGQHGLLLDGPRENAARMRTDGILASITLADMRMLLEENPHWWREIARLTRRNERIAIIGGIDLTERNARRRTILVLLRLAGCRLEHLTALEPYAIAVSQAEFAAHCNLSRNAVSEILNDLEARALVSLGYRNIEIRDTLALRAIFLD